MRARVFTIAASGGLLVDRCGEPLSVAARRRVRVLNHYLLPGEPDRADREGDAAIISAFSTRSATGPIIQAGHFRIRLIDERSSDATSENRFASAANEIGEGVDDDPVYRRRALASDYGNRRGPWTAKQRRSPSTRVVAGARRLAPLVGELALLSRVETDSDPERQIGIVGEPGGRHNEPALAHRATRAHLSRFCPASNEVVVSAGVGAHEETAIAAGGDSHPAADHKREATEHGHLAQVGVRRQRVADSLR